MLSDFWWQDVEINLRVLPYLPCGGTGKCSPEEKAIVNLVSGVRHIFSKRVQASSSKRQSCVLTRVPQ